MIKAMTIAAMLFAAPIAHAAEMTLMLKDGDDVILTQTFTADSVARVNEALGSACTVFSQTQRGSISLPCTEREIWTRVIGKYIKSLSDEVASLERIKAAREHPPLETKP